MEFAGISTPPAQMSLSDYNSIVQELQSLRQSYEELQSRHSTVEESLVNVTNQRDQAVKQNSDLEVAVEETSLERDLLYDLIRQLDAYCKEKQLEIEGMVFDEMSIRKELETEVEVYCGRIEKLESEMKERDKEKKELEERIMSLTEENRDLNSFLKAALMEKEAVKRNLKEVKGNNEQKRTALLQIAERGLQKFGFIIGTSEQTVEDPEPSSIAGDRRSDGGESEEETVTLASTVETVTKNLRLEITQLRRSLQDSRSDCERLQSLVDKQAQKISENALYIQELEDRERSSSQNVEELTAEIKEAKVAVGRWMEACELEVEAGKKEVAERDKVVWILKRELEKKKAELEISNGKLKLKEEVAAAAMAAQAAAEQSLQLADIRATEFRNRMEELSRQLEAIESRNRRDRRKVRDRCWPWQGLRQRPLPEMQALLP
ncbi:Uncharacterized protein At3g49055 [Linum grandiflorum]